MAECPECRAFLHAKAVCCNTCGWTPTGARQIDPTRFLCVYEDRGQRCGELGTLSESTHGHGGSDGNENPRFWCAKHFPLFADWSKKLRADMPPEWRAKLGPKFVNVAVEVEAVTKRFKVHRECV